MTRDQSLHETRDASATSGPDPRIWLGALAAAALLSSGATSVARAQQVAPPASVATAAQAGDLTVGVDKALVLAMPGPGATVFVANPDIADVQAPDSRRLLIFGKKPGQTTIYVFAASGAVSRYAVTVRRDAEDVASALQTQFPDATVSVSRGPGGMSVSGRVASPAEADTLKAAAQQYLAEKESLNFGVTVDESTQVNLQIRVAEVSRQVTSELGFNWDAVFNNGTIAVGLLTGRATSTAFGQFTRDTSTSSLDSLGIGYKNGPVDVSALIDALQSNGLVTILAEPNLTAISGATATFLSGGEFPVPVSQSLDQISIEWKKYGVNVDFTPVVLSSNRISIRVRPEVSELSDVGAVKVNNISIPSVAVRRADTTVELASGQSFAIAGLFENSMSNSVQRFPGLGDLPMFGALFRSSTFKRSESELVFIVTPYIVRPVSHPSDLHLPTEAINYSNDLERILLGDLSQPDRRKPVADAHPHLAGPAGFMLEDQP